MKTIEAGDGTPIAYLEDGPPDDGATCGYFWLGGFMSDMTGSKAEALASLAETGNRPMLRFDYSGHGASGGSMTDGTISGWLHQARLMFEMRTKGPRILIGSSMGGWLALLLARALNTPRIAGLLLIAPAVDMTSKLMWDEFPDHVRDEIMTKGVWHRPSAYGNSYPITRKLIEDGAQHSLLEEQIEVRCPVHILQGDADPDVPWQHAMRLYERLAGSDIRMTLIKNGDHRLSSPLQLQHLREAAAALAAQGR